MCQGQEGGNILPESFTNGDERELRSHLSKLGAIAKEFGSTRNTIAEEHPEWVEVKDARHELFARCSTVFNCTILGFLSHLNYLSHPDVWRHQKPKPTTGQIVKSLTSV